MRLLAPGSGRAQHLCLAAVVLLGLGLRGFHYLRQPTVWHDEAAVILNILENDFEELLGPLALAQAAPPLFLWIERALSLSLGNSPMALRLLPFLAGIASLLLFQSTARRLMPGWGAVAAVLVFATSDSLLWHSCEVKPYAVDVLLATVLIQVHLVTAHRSLGLKMLAHTGLAPIFILLSYPGAFFCATSLSLLAAEVWKSRNFRLWTGYVFWAAIVAGTLAFVTLGPARAQRCDALAACWTTYFPNWDQPWQIPVWTFMSVLELFRYCFKPVGQLFVPFAVIGMLTWWRHSRVTVLALAMLPLAFSFVASFVRAYPFGGSRLAVFAAPGLALALGAGLVPMQAWLRARWRWAPLLALAVLATEPIKAMRHVLQPWPRPDCSAAAAYVRNHLEPGDSIVFNKVEYLYYFHDLETPLDFVASAGLRPPRRGSMLPLEELPDMQRCWVAFSEEPGGLEFKHLEGSAWFARREAIAEIDFPATKVLLLTARK